MRLFRKLIKGCLIGISVIVPGVSGGSMAMSMGIYDQLITFSMAKSKASLKQGKALIPYAIGIIIGVLAFSFVIELCLSYFPIPTIGAFVGMILGALPMLFQNVRGHKLMPRHVLLLLFTMGLLIVMPILSSVRGSGYPLSPTFPHALLCVLLGFMAASTMVVPGVSGSMMLLLVGCYDSVLGYLNAFTLSLLQFRWDSMFTALIIIFPFALGAIAGIVATSRLIKTLLSRYPLSTYYGIIGLVLASPFAVIYQHSAALAATDILLLVLFAAGGFALAYWLSKGEGA